jgi:hypothetical protein
MINTKLGPLGESTPKKIICTLLQKLGTRHQKKKTRTSLNDKSKPAYSGKSNQVSAVAKKLG